MACFNTHTYIYVDLVINVDHFFESLIKMTLFHSGLVSFCDFANVDYRDPEFMDEDTY